MKINFGDYLYIENNRGIWYVIRVIGKRKENVGNKFECKVYDTNSDKINKDKSAYWNGVCVNVEVKKLTKDEAMVYAL